MKIKTPERHSVDNFVDLCLEIRKQAQETIDEAAKQFDDRGLDRCDFRLNYVVGPKGHFRHH